MIHSKSKGTKLIIGLLAAILALCVCCVMLISNGKSNVGVAYAESTAVETTDTTTTPETEQTEIDYSTMFEWKIDYTNQCVSLTRYTGNYANVVIPDIIADYPVTSINSRVFSGNTSLVSVTISENVTSIGEGAFQNCTNLTRVNIPRGIGIINRYLFYGCSNLTSVDIPEDSKLSRIWEYAFERCTNLTSINLPESVANIEEYAFYCCTNLSTINLSKNLTKIGNAAFAGCTSLMSLNLPNSLTSISGEAFSGCSNLTSVYILGEVVNMSVGSQAFSACDSLTGVYVTSIDSWCNIDFLGKTANPLYYAKNLYLNDELVMEVTISSGAKGIGWCTFYNYTHLTSVTILENSEITSIGSSAFYGCVNLETINLPESVKSIGSSAFYGCSALIGINIPNSVTEIGSYAFYNCYGLKTVDISNSSELSSIKEYTFYNCSALTSINIPNSVTKIEREAFRNCVVLETVTILENSILNNIGERAFWGCSSLSSIYIPKGVTTIGGGVFSGCSSLSSINIPDGVTTIGSGVFSGCSSLSSINIPDGVTTIESSAFSQCSSLSSINIPDGVTAIGSGVFSGCSKLTSVNIPDAVASIGDYLFANCSSLIEVKLPETATYFGYYVFQNCTNLEKTNIPQGITEICGNSFSGCSKINNLIIPNGVTTIGSYAFKGCSNLTSINIPESVVKMGRDAFSGCKNLKDVYITSIEKWCEISFGGEFTTPLYYDANLYLNNELITELIIPEGTTFISEYALSKCDSITKVVMPDTLISIGGSAFSACANLKSVHISKNIETIGKWAFAYCNSLEEVMFDENSVLKSIEGCLFYECNSLSNIIIPKQVVSIGERSFYECNNLKTVAILSNDITDIGSRAFYNCRSLTSINLPNSITSIEFDAFAYCVNLTEANIPLNLKTIGIRAFSACSSLNTLYISSTVTSIGDSAFINCENLEIIYIKNAELASNVTSYSAQGYLFSANSRYGARQAIAIIGENPTVGSYITDNYANTEVITYNGNTYTVYSTHEHAWELDYKIEPDCVTDGFEQYVCTTCGLVKNNVIPATGHTESDWIVDINATTDCAGHKYVECTVCKEVLLEEEIPAIGVVVDEEINYQHSCSFHNNLTLNFYIPAEDLNKYDSFYLFVEQDIYANGIWGVQSFEIRKSELTSNGYKFVFTGIGAADAGNEIRATLYAQLGDVQYKSLVDVYSVKTYAYNRLAKSTDAQFKTLLVDMLNYCSAAQVYFGVNTDNLVNADLTEEQKALATATDSTVADTSSTVALEGATAQIKAKSIVFNSNIEVKFYMDLSAYQDLTGIALRITYTDGLGVTHVTVVESTEFVYEKSQESYTAKLIDLNSAELRAQIQVEITLDEQVISDTLYYSVETYVYNRLNKSTDENFKALLKVLMKYSDSANKYFYKGGN